MRFDDAPGHQRTLIRSEPAEAPRGSRVLPWIGPGLLWMVSAVGTGSVLFTPRVASHYGYTLFWVIPAVCALMWVMVREAGRYSIVTGDTLLEGFDRMPGPRGWAVWVIFVPQMVAAVAGIAGLGAMVGSALQVAFGGRHTWWGIGFIALAATLVSAGGYRRVEQSARVLAVVLLGITVAAAFQVAPAPADLAAGLVPSVPGDADLYVIVPWIGTILAGSMGIVWFSYWTTAKGYGAPTGSEASEVTAEEVDERLSGWIKAMSRAAAAGVIGGAAVLTAFLVLGTELLAPAGIVPEGNDVAADLARLLGDVWGRTGFWLMIVAVIVALGGSIFANQDGWGRSFADMTVILLHRRPHRERLVARRHLKTTFVMVLTGVLPVVVVLLFEDPVAIMSASGIVAALHTPLIVSLIIAVNRRQLPGELRPGLVISSLMALSAAFYAVVGTLQLLSL